MQGLPGGSDGKESSCNAGGLHSIPGLGSSPWRRAWQLSPVFWLGESPWTEKSGGLQSMGSQRAGHDWSDLAQHTHCIYDMGPMIFMEVYALYMTSHPLFVTSWAVGECESVTTQALFSLGVMMSKGQRSGKISFCHFRTRIKLEFIYSLCILQWGE